MAKKTEKIDVPQDRPLPPWAQHVLYTWRNSISSCFIIHGSGVTDHVDNWNINLIGMLNRALTKQAIVVHYSLSNGVTFRMEAKTMPDGTVGEGSPSQDLFLKLVSPQAPAGAKPDELLAPFRDPNTAIQTFDRLLLQAHVTEAENGGQERKPLIAVVVHMAEYIVPEGDLGHMPKDMRQLIATMERWGRETRIQSNGNIVILTTRSLLDLHGRLRLAGSKYEAVELTIPTESDRKEYISYIQRPGPLPYEPGLNDSVFSKLTAGLSRVGIEDIKYQTPVGGQLTRAMVTKRKNDLIRLEYGDVIGMLDPRAGYESVGGYDEIKDAFRKRIVRQMRDGLPADWSGVMLVGPGGTGKTVLAEATAFEIGVPCVAFNIGKMKSKYVGESEKNVAKGIQLLREMAPVVCWIDEIDGALPNRNDANQDSGVSAGILAQFLPFLSDPDVRKRIVFIAATNRSDKVDSALKRVGRFDRIIPMVAPIVRDREALFTQVYLRGIALDKALLAELVAGTNGWTGAEIRNLVNKSHEIVDDTGMSLGDALRKALTVIRPNTADIMGLTAIALLECNDLDLLPEEHRKTLLTADGRMRFVTQAVEYARDAAMTGQVRVRRDN